MAWALWMAFWTGFKKGVAEELERYGRASTLDDEKAPAARRVSSALADRVVLLDTFFASFRCNDASGFEKVVPSPGIWFGARECGLVYEALG